CLVRTDPTSEKRQEGISFLLIDMKTPGVSVRPLILMDGAHEVNEVFFDDVGVPAENLVHEEGKGWTVAKYLLGYERMNTGRIGESKRQLARLKEFSSGKLNDVRFRDRLSRVEVELTALEITNLRFLDRMRRSGQPPGADVSMLKIKGTEIQQALAELMMQAAGEARRKILASPEGWSARVWSQLAQMGLTGLPFSPDYGGFGGGAVDLMGVMEAFGEALVVEPYLATLMGAHLVARAGSAEQKRAI